MTTSSPPVTCPVCAGSATFDFLSRPGVPVHQNLVMPSEPSAFGIKRGDLTLTCCESCGFIFNRTFDLSKLNYSAEYDNTQSCSSVFFDYLGAQARDLLDRKGVRDCHIVEVGCGKGLFLRKLVEDATTGNTGTGFDPSYVGPEHELNGRLRFEKRFYGPECASLATDVVVCRHVIEHVPDPLTLLHAVHEALAQSQHARVFFETPDVTWILENRVVWDFFYEHCSYWTPSSLSTAFARAGFVVDDVHLTFGNQYQWLEARVARSASPPRVTAAAATTAKLARDYALGERELLQRLDARLSQLSQAGAVALWGAGAKGVTLANALDPDRTRIACVVDLNPAKTGQFLPGTGHPIVDYRALPTYGVKTALLMNPNYRAENLLLLSDAGLQIDLLDPISAA